MAHSVLCFHLHAIFHLYVCVLYVLYANHHDDPIYHDVYDGDDHPNIYPYDDILLHDRYFFLPKIIK